MKCLQRIYSIIPSRIRKWANDRAWDILEDCYEEHRQWKYEAHYFPEDAGPEPKPSKRVLLTLGWWANFILDIDPTWY